MTLGNQYSFGFEEFTLLPESCHGLGWVQHEGHHIRFNVSYESVFTARKRSVGQGNVFAAVCHSVGGVGFGFPACTTGHMTGGFCILGGRLDPPLRAVRDTVNKRALRILLECILVFLVFF